MDSLCEFLHLDWNFVSLFSASFVLVPKRLTSTFRLFKTIRKFSLYRIVTSKVRNGHLILRVVVSCHLLYEQRFLSQRDRGNTNNYSRFFEGRSVLRMC